MNRSQLVAAVSADSGIAASETDAVLTSLATVVASALKSRDKVALPGFVAFEAKFREARDGRNPATGEAIKIAASWAVKITPGSALKAAANE